MNPLAALLLSAMAPAAVLKRVQALELHNRESHALASARLDLTWTGALPVQADLVGTFLPSASYACSFMDARILYSTGTIPLIVTRFRLNQPLAQSARACMFGSTVEVQGDTVPPNPILGVIVFPTSQVQKNPSILQVCNVVNMLMPAGTHTIFEVNCNLRRGDLS